MGGIPILVNEQSPYFLKEKENSFLDLLYKNNGKINDTLKCMQIHPRSYTALYAQDKEFKEEIEKSKIWAVTMAFDVIIQQAKNGSLKAAMYIVNKLGHKIDVKEVVDIINDKNDRPILQVVPMETDES